MPEIKIKTRGMHCGSCEILIEDALEDLKGVRKVNASHKSGSVSVVFDDGEVSEEKIKEAIRSEGYHPE